MGETFPALLRTSQGELVDSGLWRLRGLRGKYRWRLWGAGSQFVAELAATYDTLGQAGEAARRVQTEADGAEVRGSSSAEAPRVSR